jgi:hypothetical protein
MNNTYSKSGKKEEVKCIPFSFFDSQKIHKQS